MSHDDLLIPANLHPTMGLLYGALEDSSREWRQELGSVSVEALTWQPFPKGYSIGTLLLHIAEVEGWWVQEIIGGTPYSLPELSRLSSEIEVDKMIWPTPPNEPLEWYMDILKRIRAETLECLQGVDPLGIRTSQSNNTFTPQWVMAHVVEHDSYHGGQAVMLKAIFSAQA